MTHFMLEVDLEDRGGAYRFTDLVTLTKVTILTDKAARDASGSIIT
jgi:hypothetical protein